MGVKKVIKKGFNFKYWIGADYLKVNAKVIGRLFTTLFKHSKQQVQEETFEQCMKRFNLTEEDLQKRMQYSKHMALFCLGTSILLLVYMFYLFTQTFILSGIVCLILALLMAAYTFREHFNLFQMKQRRLGCTIQQWFNATFKGSK